MTIGTRFLVVAFLLGSTAAALRLDASSERPLAQSRLDGLEVPGAQLSEDVRLDPETEGVLRADQYVLRTYARGGLPMTVFVAYYASQRSGRTVHSPLNCLPGTGWTWAARGLETVDLGNGESIAVNRNLAERNGTGLLVYYWYQSHGRVTASEYQQKALLVRDALLLHRSDGALVRVTTPWPAAPPEPSAEPAAFIGNVYSAVTRQLPE